MTWVLGQAVKEREKMENFYSDDQHRGKSLV